MSWIHYERACGPRTVGEPDHSRHLAEPGGFRMSVLGRKVKAEAGSPRLRVLRDGPLRALTHVLPPRRRDTCDKRPAMIRLIWTLSAHTRYYLRRYMPTNRLLDAIRRRRGLKWGIPAMLLAVPYLLIASICTHAIADGGPGWLLLGVLWAVWNSMKFIIMGPVSLVLLVRARTQEAIARRRTRQAHP